MKILLVEDDDHKMHDIISIVKEIDTHVIVETAFSVASGVQKAVDNEYDLLLLDMTIPNFDNTEGKDGGPSYKNGGELIIRELIDEEINFRCAVITQYETFNNETIEQISERISALCRECYYGYIKYSTMDENWKVELKKLLQKCSR